MKIDYSKLFTLKKDGRYQGYWHEMKDGKPVGMRHAICDRDPKRLYERIVEKETPAAATFGYAAQKWWDKHVTELRRSSQSTYRAPFKMLVEEFGDKPIHKVGAAEIDSVLQHQKNCGKSYKHAATIRSIAKQIFDFAIGEKMITANPVNAVSVPRGMKRGKTKAPEKDIIQIIKDNLDKPFGDFVALLLYTGMRTEEAVALVWEDIGEDRICIHSAIDLHGAPLMSDTKTEAGVRYVPILPQLLPYIHRPKNATGDQFVFSENGKVLTRAQISTKWLNWCKEAGLAEKRVVKGRHRGKRECERTEWHALVTPHKLRHNFATVLFEENVDTLTTQYIMGHKDIETTRRIYTSLRKDYLDNEFDKLKDIFE